MTDDDNEMPDIDWTEMREAALKMAEVMYSYHQALIAAGFVEATAVKLTVAYQSTWLQELTK